MQDSKLYMVAGKIFPTSSFIAEILKEEYADFKIVKLSESECSIRCNGITYNRTIEDLRKIRKSPDSLLDKYPEQLIYAHCIRVCFNFNLSNLQDRLTVYVDNYYKDLKDFKDKIQWTD